MELLGVLYELRGVGGGEDAVCWVGRSDEVLTISSFYESLLGSVNTLFPWCSMWFVGAPPKVSIFIWLASLERILTIDNRIRRRQVIINWCCV